MGFRDKLRKALSREDEEVTKIIPRRKIEEIPVSHLVANPKSKDVRFAEEGITLQYHQYTPVPYRQRYAPFIPHLSVIDLLCNEGPRSLEIIRAGRGLQVGH